MRRAAILCLLALFCAAAAGSPPARLNVCLYFDGEDNAAGFRVGERSAVMVRNLLGHFAEVDVFMAPVSRYAGGELAGCDRAIYMGTYFEAKLPGAFLADAAQYRQPFLWMNYNIWRLQQRLGQQRFRAAWGFDYQRIDGKLPRVRGEIPSFYSAFAYKGATFRKVAFLDAQGALIAHPEMVIVANHSAEVLSEAIHSANKARAPYALRKGPFFYIADNPVSVIDERDRYLILADLLFDFLGLAPRTTKRYATVRIEDIHPGYDLRMLHQTIEVFRDRKVPFAISLIPRYVGPGSDKGLELAQDVKFLRLIRYAIASGATILAHGYEHQLPMDLGCGVSHTGEGYEFWDVCRNRPLPFDSVAFVQDRLDKAKRILHEARIPYAGWVTPHYAASPLAIRVIHGNFGRVLQRMRYFLEGVPMTAANAIDQFFPYTIAHDYYGIYVWPENLGYVPLPSHGGKPQHVDGMLEIARLNKVVRDAWASFFWHPVLIKTELGIHSLEKLVDGIRAEGYEFVSLYELRKRGE
jgi:uncharacterized protein YdaL